MHRSSIVKLLRRISLITLGFCCAWMLFSYSGITGFAARATGTVKNRILNVRTEASTGSSIKCKLSQGCKVTILSETTGTDGMKWYNIYFAYNNDALEGYVRADLILTSTGASTSSEGTNTTTPLRAIRPNAAIVRATPSTAASIQTRLYKGTVISVISEQTATDGRKWSKVTYYENGTSKEGYIRSDLLTAAPAGAVLTGSTASVPSSTPVTEGAKKYVNTNVAIVRTYASTNGDIRSRLVQGTQVSVIKAVTGSDDQRTWYKVSYSENNANNTGYIRGDLLTDLVSSSAGTSGSSENTGSSNTSSGNSSSSTSSSSAGKTATVQPVVANIRSYASTSGDIRSKLSHGTIITILSEKTGDDNQTWYKISYTVNGVSMQGYIRGDLVTLASSGNTGSPSGNPSSGSNTSSENNSSSNENNSSNNNTGSPGVAQVLSYASPNADVRATLSNGTKVSIIKEVTGEDNEKWTKIRFELDGKQVEGYVRSSILK